MAMEVAIPAGKITKEMLENRINISPKDRKRNLITSAARNEVIP